MYMPISFRSILTIIVIAVVAASAFAQDEPAERSPVLEVRMYLVLGADTATSANPIPKAIENTVAGLRRDTAQKDFSLLDFQMGRMTDRGMFESRGVLDLRQTAVAGHPIFTEFQIMDARAVGGAAPIMIGTVQSGLRVPVRSVSGPAGSVAVVNYEKIGYVGKRITVDSGVPTVVGSYSLQSDGGTVYLVLTVTRLAN